MSKQILFAVSLIAFAFGPPTVADETSAPASERLQNDQAAVSGRYARFERLLSQMADMLGHEDPERAELLRRAISKGREHAIASELDTIARTLGKANFGAARERQVGVTKSLQSLLKLLQSEDRRSSVEKDAERLENLQKNLRNAITEAKAARNSAQNSTAPSNAAPAQNKVLDKTDKILKDVRQHDQANATEAGGKNSEDERGASKSGENSAGKKPNSESNSKNPSSSKPGEEKTPSSNEGDPKDGSGEKAGKSGEPTKSDPPTQSEAGKSDGARKGDPPKDSQPSKSGQGKGQSPKPGKSQPGASSPNTPSEKQSEDSEKTPGREKIEEAKQFMQKALEQLKEQEREEAVVNQDESITKLQKAVEEIEETLKQLREEEKEMVLAALEARFQRLLALQTQFLEATIDLDATPRKDWLDNAISQCRELSQQQADLTQECSQTTGLLREDGTSVSIIVAVEDIEADMGNVTTRLQKTKTGALTQSMESDIIEALNELIKATQKEMQEMKSEQRQQQKQKSQNQKKPPLVALMAEIRVLRSLQIRVNRRTTQVHELLQEGDLEDESDLNEQLGELADRQYRLRESAAELADRMEQQR